MFPRNPVWVRETKGCIRLGDVKHIVGQVEANDCVLQHPFNQCQGLTDWLLPNLVERDRAVLNCPLKKHREAMQADRLGVKI